MKFILFFITILCFQGTLFALDNLCDLAPTALRSAERIRGLESKRAVPCKVKNKQEVLANLNLIINREITPEKIKNEEFLFRKLTIIPKDFNYKEGIMELYTSQLAGFYDPIEEFYVTASWMPEMMQFPIAVHELVHALQDQYYNLDDFIDAKKFTTDEALARSAVAEGDATLVTNDYLTKLTGKSLMVDTQNVSGYVAETVLGSKMMEDFAAAPESLQAMMLFPYTSGLAFTHQMIKGKGYQELDQLYTNPPQTTSEILHAGKYVNKKVFKKITLKELSEFFEVKIPNSAYQDRLGEFVISTILPSPQRQVSVYWENDLAIIDKEQVYWLTKWSSSSKALEFAEAFKQVNQEQILKVQVKENLVGFVLK